jgi:hypothetical protein
MTRDEAIEVIREEDSELLQRLSHDELLERIGQLDCEVNKGQDGVKVTAKGYDLLKHSFALLAVVELHRNVDGACWECQDAIYHEYPCPTIRAIEKELR